MSKKVISFIIAIPALLFLFGYKLIPAVYSLVISMTHYSPAKGISGSQWLGFKNYSFLLNSADFGKVLYNSLTLNILSIIFTCILAFVLIICISIMPGRLWKIVSVILISIPAFIPAVSVADVFIKALSFDTGFVNNVLRSLGMQPVNFFAQASLYPFLFAVMDSLRSIYIPVIIGVLACEKSTHADLSSIFLVLLGYVAAKTTMLLSPDYENITASYNAFVADKAKVFDIYHHIYTPVRQQGNLGLEAAPWVIRTFLQLLINISVYFVFSFLAPGISNIADNIRDKVNRGFASIAGILGYLVFAAGSIAVTVLALIPSNGLFKGIQVLFETNSLVTAFANSLVYCIYGCIIYGLITITLAYPLAAKTRVYPLIVILLTALTNNFIGGYLFFRDIGMTNTAFPVIISSGLSLMGAFGLYYSITGKFRDHMPGISEYLMVAIKPLITIVVLFFIVNWGSFTYQQLYLSNPSQFGVGLVDLQIIKINNIAGSLQLTADMQSARSAFIFLSSLVPALLGIILIFLERYLPLSAFSAQIRKD